jgi:hypothetical protein
MLLDKRFDNKYTLIYTEILQGLNLKDHLEEVTHALTQIEEIIVEGDTEPLSLKLWEQIQNELYWLKLEILKRL